MKLQHTDATRRRPEYCDAVCVLCGAAARMQLAHKHDAALVQMSQQIRAMHPSEFVDYDVQSPVVQAFLLLAGMPAITPIETTTGQPLPTTAVPSAGGEEPGP